MTAIATIQPTSAIRRKPLFTYKSPSGPSLGPFLEKLPRSTSSSSSATTASPTNTASTARTTQSSTPSSPSKAVPKRHDVPLDTKLPLYHPQGSLALSLPPLDAVSYGLPQLQVPIPIPPQDDSESGNPTNRAREPRAARAGSADSTLPAMPSVSSIAAVARDIKDREEVEAAIAKEKASPKKRQVRGRRKRKSPDDTDLPYPAKRTRVPRGSAVADDSEQMAGIEADANQNGSASDSNEPTDVVVRTTRSRTAKRREPSETPSSSDQAPAPAAPATEPPPAQREESAEVMKAPSEAPSAATADKPSPTAEKEGNDKEEGELSES